MKADFKFILILILLSIVWGSSFILMKRGMIDKESGDLIFSSMQVGAMRMLFASSVLLPIGLRSIKIITSVKTGISLAAVSLAGSFIPAFLFTFAETGISSGYTGMLNSTTPIFTLIIGTLFFSQKLIPKQIYGVIIGTIGIVILVNGVSVVDTSGTYLHVLAVVTATICYALSTNTMKYNLSHLAPFKVTSVAFVFAFLPALFLFFYFDTPTTIAENEHASEALIYISILAIVGTALSLILFNYLISNTSALFASSVTYLIPIVAVIIGFFDGEELSWIQVIAMFIILFGVYVANRLKKQRIN
ncbi:DMT family transporter [Brumimicrobium aurantiacum]|uniref:DMT family transporter n=1 Tax=Brumimicrobium aurantiacum TaxID=1737063 RepID=A0A3E1EV00_9FLAO|nr:DMT family transporter [Brumimicrobium aurantiacum]RFC53303.1 DMT family transporter [Brumimicrobium aurantiacum]